MSGAPDDCRLPVQPRNYLRPCLLLLLREEPTYGYELRDKLSSLSASHWDPGTVYRALNTMEDEGLVRSTWERSAEGPRRRRYEISAAGSTELDAWAHELCAVRDMIGQFIGRYETGDRGHPEVTADVPNGRVNLAGVGEAVVGGRDARVVYDTHEVRPVSARREKTPAR